VGEKAEKALIKNWRKAVFWKVFITCLKAQKKTNQAVTSEARGNKAQSHDDRMHTHNQGSMLATKHDA
jgi:hypothetical protein